MMTSRNSLTPFILAITFAAQLLMAFLSSATPWVFVWIFQAALTAFLLGRRYRRTFCPRCDRRNGPLYCCDYGDFTERSCADCLSEPEIDVFATSP